MLSVAIIMTVFNRLENTKRCIKNLEEALSHVPHTYYITNDGSSDDTETYLNSISDTINLTVFHGDGTLFWNRGMYHSFENAMKKGYDFYLWVNNDTFFFRNMWEVLIKDYYSAIKFNPFSIICGSLQSVVTGRISYGGTGANGLIEPNGQIAECTHINGNCVLIPKNVAMKIGNLDYRFEHGLGDFDYGQRILSQGGKLFISSEYVGTCENNPVEGTWKDRTLPIKQRIKLMKSKTGLPRYSYKVYLKKWNKKNWLLYYYKPYFDIFKDSIKRKIGRK